MNGTLEQLKTYAVFLRRYFWPQRRMVLLMALWLFSGIGLQLYLPRVLRDFIDLAVAGGEQRLLLFAALLFIGIAFLNQGLSALATWFSAVIGWRCTNVMREDLARHCLDLDMGFHNQHTPGEMIERVDGDVTNLSNFFSKFTVQVVGGFILLAGVLVMMFLEDVRAGSALLAFTVLSGAVLFRYRSIGVDQAEIQRETSSNLFGFIEEQLAGIEDVRANGGGDYVLDGFYRHNYNFFHQTRKSWMLTFTLFLITMGLFNVGHVISLGMGSWLYFKGAITIGTVMLFFQYTEFLRNPLQEITRQLQDLQNATAGMRRINNLLDIKSGLSRGTDAALPDHALSVTFDNVHFRYHENSPVLKGLSFKLPAGSSLGLIGRTGSGKTTIARLLFRLYDPQEGLVEVGGMDVRNASRLSVRRHIGMVTQDVQLFNATVRENLTFFDREIPDERIRQVIDELGLHAWFETFPQGLDTVLPAEGGGLSAGEAQLLAFSRIFLRDPGLVILDEPSSRMDPATEKLVQQAFQRLMQDRTAIIIAHRLDTLEKVDRILLIEDGKALEEGLRVELAADPSTRFHRLLHMGSDKADLDREGGDLLA